MPTKKAYNLLRVFNETLDTLHWSYDFDQQISIQAKDKNGVWREIFTHIPSDVISDYKQHLAPNKFWDFHIQTYSGGFKTKMRVVVKIPELWNYEWDWGKGKEKLQDAKEFISNEIDCEINASQFVRDGFQKARFETFPFEDYEFQQFRPIG